MNVEKMVQVWLDENMNVEGNFTIGWKLMNVVEYIAEVGIESASEVDGLEITTHVLKTITGYDHSIYADGGYIFFMIVNGELELTVETDAPDLMGVDVPVAMKWLGMEEVVI